jgi:predicted HNH restriction endonuclease
MPERSRNLQDKPQAKEWFDQHPEAKANFDIVVQLLRSKYSGHNDGYVNIGGKKASQYRFNYKENGYIVVHGQVGAIIVVFGTGKNKHRFEVRSRDDLEAISRFLKQHTEEYAGFNFEILDAEFKKAVVDFFKLSDDQIQAKTNNNSVELPKKIQKIVNSYVRNPKVVAKCLYLAKGICGKCNLIGPFLKRANNERYLEVHHIIPLSKNGLDKVENTVALCPNCHREIHDILGMDSEDE